MRSTAASPGRRTKVSASILSPETSSKANPHQHSTSRTLEIPVPVTVRIPQPLRNLTGNLSTVSADGSNLESLVTNLEGAYPGMRERVMDESGQLRRFVNIYVN